MPQAPAPPREAPPEALPEPPEKQPLWRNPYVLAVLAAMVIIPLMRPFLRFEPPPPAVIGQLPPFELTSAEGQPFGSADLEGQVWVVNFIFTRCTSICPLLTRSMARRPIRKVLFGSFGAGVEGARLEVSGSMKPIAAQDAAIMMSYSDKVIVVPDQDQGGHFDVFQSRAGVMFLARQHMAKIKLHRAEISHAHLQILFDEIHMITRVNFRPAHHDGVIAHILFIAPFHHFFGDAQRNASIAGVGRAAGGEDEFANLARMIER